MHLLLHPPSGSSRIVHSPASRGIKSWDVARGHSAAKGYGRRSTKRAAPGPVLRHIKALLRVARRRMEIIQWLPLAMSSRCARPRHKFHDRKNRILSHHCRKVHHPRRSRCNMNEVIDKVIIDTSCHCLLYVSPFMFPSLFYRLIRFYCDM